MEFILVVMGYINVLRICDEDLVDGKRLHALYEIKLMIRVDNLRTVFELVQLPTDYLREVIPMVTE